MNLTVEEYFEKLNIHTKYFEQITPDGSERQFFRLEFDGRPAVAVFPAPGPTGMAEARSLAKIAFHLWEKKINVPQPLFFDSCAGVVIMEDRGNERFQNLVENGSWQAIGEKYEQVLQHLAEFQIKGIEDFDTTWCYDTKNYNSSLALEKEVFYFINSFLKDLVKYEPDRALSIELHKIALKVDALHYNHFLLHRDFQSRNILIQDMKPWFIDFQAARKGPLAYDVASLLLDPYTNIDTRSWPQLIHAYINYINENLGAKIKEGLFMEDFAIVSLLRTLQVLGAFAFLTKKKGKTFFAKFIPVAISRLKEILDLFYPSTLYKLHEVVEHLGRQNRLWNFRQ